MFATYTIYCAFVKSLFPFVFKNHNITLIDLWVEPGLGGYLAGTDPPHTLLYLGPVVMKIYIPSSTPVGIKGLWKVIPL